VVTNTPENMIKWVQSPRSVDDRTAMPDVGLSDRQAKDVAAYLYTLR
jgi:cytochrome c1